MFLWESFSHQKEKNIFKNVSTYWPYLEGPSARKTGFLFLFRGLIALNTHKQYGN